MKDLEMWPARGQVWRHRWLRDRYVAVIEVKVDGRVRFAAVAVSSLGHVSRDVRRSQPYLDQPAGLRRVFELTDYRLDRRSWWKVPAYLRRAS